MTIFGCRVSAASELEALRYGNKYYFFWIWQRLIALVLHWRFRIFSGGRVITGLPICCSARYEMSTTQSDCMFRDNFLQNTRHSLTGWHFYKQSITKRLWVRLSLFQKTRTRVTSCDFQKQNITTWWPVSRSFLYTGQHLTGRYFIDSTTIAFSIFFQQRLTCPIRSLGDQQSCYWPNVPGILRSQPLMGKLRSIKHHVDGML